ncbi:MAG: hypothetical protein ACO25D_07165 [Burkholderiaceae bacterium]|jgi:hypothetical protein
MEPKKLDKSWQALTDSICNDYPNWFSTQLQSVMKHVFVDLEGLHPDQVVRVSDDFLAYEDMFECATNRHQLLKDLETGFSLFESRDGFGTMDPAMCAREIIRLR